MRILVGALLVAIVVAGCAKTSDTSRENSSGSTAQNTETSPPAETGGAKTPVPVSARIQGDHQVVTVTVTETGYSPAAIQLKAGVPAKVVFKQTTDSQCLAQVKINDFGITATDLPVNQETTIEFTPGQTGTYTFTCGMDMARGTIIVAS